MSFIRQKVSFDARIFSENKHSHGSWNTKILTPVLYSFASFFSFKYQGLFHLLNLIRNNAMILDLGCGTGSYSIATLRKMNNATIVALDWSFIALKSVPKKKQIFRVCADASMLPFKEGVFDAVYSIDTLGHLDSVVFALNELLRITRKGAMLFLHSECCDYRCRWPDLRLIERCKRDIPAEGDGHIGLYKSIELYRLFKERFILIKSFSPAGIAGWLIGYPEKYYPAFKEAKMPFFAMLTLSFAIIKRVAFFKFIFRVFNVFTNYCELYFNLHGGGSCFVLLRKE